MNIIFLASVTNRGGVYIGSVKKKFKELKILDKVQESPFVPFFSLSEMKLHGMLVHSLLLRKIETRKRDRIHFKLGETECMDSNLY